MKVQIKEGPPHINMQLSRRDQQIFDRCAISGRMWAGYVDGEIVACWGAVPPSYLAQEAYLWMWDLPLKHPLIVARHSRQVINSLLNEWDVLHGHCFRGTTSLKWLRWLGAVMCEPQGALVPFVIRRP